MQRLFSRQVAAALGLAVLLAVLAGSLVWRETARQAQAADRAAHARELLAVLDGLNARLADAEACRCSFLVRAERVYADRFRDATDAVRRDLRHLRDRDTPDAPLGETADRVAAKLELLEQSVRLRQRQRFNDRAQLALTQKVQAAGEALRTSLVEVRQRVDGDLAGHSRQARSSARMASTVAGVGNVLTLLILGFAGASVSRDLVCQRRSAELARKAASEAEGHAAAQAARLLQTQEALAEQARLQAVLEEHFRQAQRLASVGRVSSEVIHDFNNLLGVILACSETTLLRLKPDDPSREVLAQAVQAGHRAAALTRQVLAIGRTKPGAVGPHDLNAVAAEMGPILRRVAGVNVEVHLDLAATLPAVLADRGQLEQVLLNLAANARDAMPDGGKLLIQTRVANGGRALLAVADTGCGMDEQTKARMFEPFFTTKAEGKGTGLGMAIIQDAVARAGGSIEVDSEPGKGTCVRVYLRLAGEGGGSE